MDLTSVDRQRRIKSGLVKSTSLARSLLPEGSRTIGWDTSHTQAGTVSCGNSARNRTLGSKSFIATQGTS